MPMKGTCGSLSVSPFYAYYKARELENLSSEDSLLPVFSSSDIKIFPFQIAAANFALHSPYQKGALLCDESGMGKSHETMIVLTEKWYEGKNRLMLAIPNADLLDQWIDMIEKHYTIPYVVMKNTRDISFVRNEENTNPFLQDALIITTYEFLAQQQKLALQISWDTIAFEEATALSSVYQTDNKQARILKNIANNAFKLLLTGTPIEKNIMDLYGLIYFIDETILPPEQEFLQRYLRRPENYPELAQKVSKYCFRTLRQQAKQYAKVPNRIPVTLEYIKSKKEQELYSLLFSYCQKEHSTAFPEMNPYDLSLRLLSLYASSTAAILQTIDGIIERLEQNSLAKEELSELQQMKNLARSISIDAKTIALQKALSKAFKLQKKIGAAQKVIVFTESVVTQKYLYDILKEEYSTVIYNGSADYSAIKAFQGNVQILISTDHGARGFNLEQCSLVVQYDLLYNTLKMEQRIDRCHRLGQNNDVIVLSFIDKENFADVRKLELVNKRMLVADGVFGLSDEVVGGFCDNLDTAFTMLSEKVRTPTEIEADYNKALFRYEEENKELVSSAENILFTTFTRELANKLKITPKYIEINAEKINLDLWKLAKYFFTSYNAHHDDCYFEIDEKERTITAINYEKLPVLFYYWTGSRNKPYIAQKSYGMAKNFKPKHGQITLTSIIGQGIIYEIECADTGKIIFKDHVAPCQIALYVVEIRAEKRLVKEIPLLIGETTSGEILSHDKCKEILSLKPDEYTESDHKAPHWLRNSSAIHRLDRLVPVDELLNSQREKLTDAQAEEVERIKQRAKIGKSELSHTIDDLQLMVKRLEQELQNNSADRMKTMLIKRGLTQKRQDLAKKQDSRFFEEMQLDVEIEKQINEFLGKETLTARVVRQFVVEVKSK
ncbi:MAG: DEAD/DEAH box helicase [Oscillospiraceae bacterium]